MLVLTKGQTAETIIVTLNEKRTLSTGYYLFYFEHITTGQTATKIFSFSEDESLYPDRYNKFTVNTSTVFMNKDSGEWTYKIYEQAGGVNINPAGLTLVEYGILKLNAATTFTFETYEAETTYKKYNG